MIDKPTNEFQKCLVHNYLQFFIPMPEVLVSKFKMREELKKIGFGSPENYFRYIKPYSDTPSHTFRLKSYLPYCGNILFNINYLSMKYYKNIELYDYVHSMNIHPLIPLYCIIKHKTKDELLTSLFKYKNAVIKMELFPIGVFSVLFSFMSVDLPSGEELGSISRELFNFIKKIKMKCLYSIYPKDQVDNYINTQIFPQTAYIFHIIRDHKMFNFSLPKYSNWQKKGNFNLGKIQLYSSHRQRYLVAPWKISHVLRKDLLLPITWANLLDSVLDSFTIKLLYFLKDSDIINYSNVWLAIAQTLNPRIHYPSFEGRSPYFIRDYQKKIFKELAKEYLLDKKYNNFIRSLKQNGAFLNPFAIQDLIKLDEEGKLDPRLKLMVGIQSNLRRTTHQSMIDLSEPEEKVFNVLLKHYFNGYKKIYTRDLVDTEQIGWMVREKIGKELEWAEHKIYSSEKFNLQRIIMGLCAKQIVVTKVPRQNWLFCRINIQNNYVKVRLNKIIHKY